MNVQETNEIRELTDEQIEHVSGGQGVIAMSPVRYRAIGNPDELSASSRS